MQEAAYKLSRDVLVPASAVFPQQQARRIIRLVSFFVFIFAYLLLTIVNIDGFFQISKKNGFRKFWYPEICCAVLRYFILLQSAASESPYRHLHLTGYLWDI